MVLGHIASCQADPVKDFQVYATGGDGGLVQFCESELYREYVFCSLVVRRVCRVVAV